MLPSKPDPRQTHDLLGEETGEGERETEKDSHSPEGKHGSMKMKIWGKSGRFQSH